MTRRPYTGPKTATSVRGRARQRLMTKARRREHEAGIKALDKAFPGRDR